MSTKQNLRWGLRLGVTAAAVVCLYVVVSALIGGSWQFESLGVSGTTLILVVLFLGLLLGVVLGLLRPLEQWPRLGMVAGYLVGGILLGGALYIVGGAAALTGGGLLGGFLGFAIGVLLFYKGSRRDSSDRKEEDSDARSPDRL